MDVDLLPLHKSHTYTKRVTPHRNALNPCPFIKFLLMGLKTLWQIFDQLASFTKYLFFKN